MVPADQQLHCVKYDVAEFVAGYPLRKLARRHEFRTRLLLRLDFAPFSSLRAL